MMDNYQAMELYMSHIYWKGLPTLICEELSSINSLNNSGYIGETEHFVLQGFKYFSRNGEGGMV